MLDRQPVGPRRPTPGYQLAKQMADRPSPGGASARKNVLPNRNGLVRHRRNRSSTKLITIPIEGFKQWGSARVVLHSLAFAPPEF